MTDEPELGPIVDARHEDEHGLYDDVRNATVRIVPDRIEIILYQDDDVWVSRALAALAEMPRGDVVIGYRNRAL